MALGRFFRETPAFPAPTASPAFTFRRRERRTVAKRSTVAAAPALNAPVVLPRSNRNPPARSPARSPTPPIADGTFASIDDGDPSSATVRVPPPLAARRDNPRPPRGCARRCAGEFPRDLPPNPSRDPPRRVQRLAPARGSRLDRRARASRAPRRDAVRGLLGPFVELGGSFGPHETLPSFPGRPPRVVDSEDMSTSRLRVGSGSPQSYASAMCFSSSVAPVVRSCSVRYLSVGRESRNTRPGCANCPGSWNPRTARDARRAPAPVRLIERRVRVFGSPLALGEVLRLILQPRLVQERARGGARHVGAGFDHDGSAPTRHCRPREDAIAERESERTQQIVQRGDVRAARHRRPVAVGVVVEETHGLHLRDVVPLREHRDAEALRLDVRLELRDLRLGVFLLGVHEEQRAVVGRVETRQGRPENLEEVPAERRVVRGVEVGVRMIAVPVQNVSLDVEVVAGTYPGGYRSE